MNKFILLILCSSGFQLYGQKPLLNIDMVHKYLQENKHSYNVKPLMPLKQLQPILLRKSVYDTAYVSHVVGAGTVFILPIDNMPCLKADSNAHVYNQPNLYAGQWKKRLFQLPFGTTDNMPNGFSGKPWVLLLPK